MRSYPVLRRKMMQLTSRKLADMRTFGEALYSEPGSGYCYIATGPSFSTTVRVAGPEDFATVDELATRPNNVFSLTVDLPDYSLSS